MAFRFALQPVMAMALALRDGIRDAKRGARPYFAALLTASGKRRETLGDGVRSVSRVLVLAATLDLIYQIFVQHAVYPVELIVVTLGLGFLPYVLLRGPVGRVARWWRSRERYRG